MAEAARQFALERYDVLDSPAEFCFDHIAKAATMALDVPFAAISFLDGDRQWFKSRIGFDVPEMPRDHAFCNHTVGQGSPVIIEDTATDPRFGKNPMVCGDLYVRSYIGVPITTPDDHNIGTVCAMDIIPRKFGHLKIDLLEQLAELVVHELELRQQQDKDHLTGAFTRSGFSKEVQKAISLYDRQRIPSTLIFFDVDQYKMVTDRVDRPAENSQLRLVIQSLTESLRATDCVGRIGGSQFAVLLVGRDRADALRETDEFLESAGQSNAAVILDLSFTEISPEFGICEDWLEQAKIDLANARKLAGSGLFPQSEMRSDWTCNASRGADR